MVTEHKIQEFIDRLPKNKARISLDQYLWPAMTAVLPEMKGHVGQRVMLSHIIEELCKRGYSKPSNKKLFDVHAIPPLPLWLKAPSQGKARNKEESYVFQSEELAFLNNYRERLRDSRWQMIDSWLLNGGRAAAWARIKERSLEIFNDEKALDDMRTKNRFFKDGYICVETLRCSHAPAPIPFTVMMDSDSDTCIVIENSDTYSTVCQWNQAAMEFRAVAYGGGNAFSSSWEGLATLKEKFGVQRFEYFGDVDGDGFNIPYRTSLKMKEQGLPLSLAKDLYVLVLQSEPIKSTVEKKSGLDSGVAEWIQNELGSELSAKTLSILATGFRIPQERCTYQKLLFISRYLQGRVVQWRTVSGVAVLLKEKNS